MPPESLLLRPRPRSATLPSGELARLKTLLRRFGPELGVAALTFVFIGITAWWLAVDQRPPDGDAGRHLNLAFDYREQFFAGAEMYWFRAEPPPGSPFYPPLIHLVGLLGAVGGLNVDGPILVMNLVFVPLLAFGCYGVASIAFDRRAGLLAAVFALAAPMTIGQLHYFMLDVPLAAVVAVTAWALLASNRFTDWRLSLAAGVALGLGMLVKPTFPVFVAPLVAVILLRGGYRNWRNFIFFGVVAVVIASPWYLKHWDTLMTVANSATGQAASGTDTNPFGTEHTRWSLDNFAWYGWTMANIHYFLPLTLFYLVGLILTSVRWLRTRRPSWAPELVVGSLAGNLGTALVMGFQDARYSFAGLVFIAALGVGWIVSARRPVHIASTVALAALLVLNTIAVNTGAFGRLDLHLPGGNPSSVAGEWKLVLIADHGYTAKAPEPSGRILDLLEAAREDGIKVFVYEGSPSTFEILDPNGLNVFGRAAGVPAMTGYDPRFGLSSIFIARRSVVKGAPAPCTRFADGTGLYVHRGKPPDGDRRRGRLYCPL